MKKRKTLNTVSAIVALLGVVLALGTIGSAELGHITFGQFVAQIITGVGLTALGARLFIETYEPSDYDYEEDEEDYYE